MSVYKRPLLLLISVIFISGLSSGKIRNQKSQNHNNGVNQISNPEKRSKKNVSSTNDLCDALKVVLTSAKFDFGDLMGKIDSSDNFYTYYQTNVKIPDTRLSCVRKSTYGITYFSVIGAYDSKEQASNMYADFISKFKRCLPDYYFEKDTSEKNYEETLFGHSTNDGYDREAGSIRMVYKSGEYQIYLFFEKGERLHFSFNRPKIDIADNEFRIDIEKLLNSCMNGFKEEKGTEHSQSFSSYYDGKTDLPGAISTTIISNTGKSKYESVFYKGENEQQARTKYDELLKRIKNVLPGDYVYSETNKDMSDLNSIVFGKKTSKSYDYIPAVSVKLVKNGPAYEVKLVVSKESI
jgi:hypothetical protein